MLGAGARLGQAASRASAPEQPLAAPNPTRLPTVAQGQGGGPWAVWQSSASLWFQPEINLLG